MKKVFVNVLKNVGKKFILDDQYAPIRKKYLAKPGVYALYDKKDRLYYVGKASELRGRLKQHAKHNKHAGKWKSFSIYSTKSESAASEVEAIALALMAGWGWPKGNTQEPKFKEDKSIKDKILKAMDRQEQERQNDYKRSRKEIFSSRRGGKSVRAAARQTGASRPKSLAGLVAHKTPLKKEYKSGPPFQAFLLPSGQIECQGKPYSSPSAAAKAATGNKSESGWIFWSIQDQSNTWITLDEFARSSQPRAGRGLSQLPKSSSVAAPGKVEQLQSKSMRSQGAAQKRKFHLKDLFSKGFFAGPQTLKKKYTRSGKDFHAILLPSGQIECHGKLYDTPSAAAEAVAGRGKNGWDFWSVEASPGQWITLKALRKSFAAQAA